MVKRTDTNRKTIVHRRGDGIDYERRIKKTKRKMACCQCKYAYFVYSEAT